MSLSFIFPHPPEDIGKKKKKTLVALCAQAFVFRGAGVAGGSIVSCVTAEVDIVGSSPTRKSFLQIDRPKVRERELAEVGAKRRAQQLEQRKC